MSINSKKTESIVVGKRNSSRCAVEIEEMKQVELFNYLANDLTEDEIFDTEI